MTSQNNKSKTLKVLLAAPIHLPGTGRAGGIASWTRIARREIETWPNVELMFADMTLRYRAATNNSLPVRLFTGSIQAVQHICHVYRRLKTDMPDLFHLCTGGGLATPKDIAMLQASRYLGVPSIVHYRTGQLPAIISRSGLEWKLTRHAMALSDCVLTLEKESEACVKAAMPDQFVVTLPNMVELNVVDEVCKQGSSQIPARTGCTRIVYVGWVIPTKGMRELVEACIQLLNHNHTLVLDIVGPVSRSFRNELQATASRAGKAKWLRFHGCVDHEQALQYIAAADLFVLPSYTEGFPNVIMEAMACGKAILSTTVGAVPGMLDIGGPQECGICIEPRDTDALVSAMTRLLNDQDKRQELGRKAKERVEKLYSAPTVCRKLVELWKSVVMDHSLEKQRSTESRS